VIANVMIQAARLIPMAVQKLVRRLIVSVSSILAASMAIPTPRAMISGVASSVAAAAKF